MWFSCGVLSTEYLIISKYIGMSNFLGFVSPILIILAVFFIGGTKYIHILYPIFFASYAITLLLYGTKSFANKPIVVKASLLTLSFCCIVFIEYVTNNSGFSMFMLGAVTGAVWKSRQ